MRQILLEFLARDKTAAASRSAAKNIDSVGDAADDAADSTEKLGKASDSTDEQVERFGKSSRTAAQHVDRLDREIESVEKELRQLAVAFAEAEGVGERFDISKAIRRTEADLRKLNRSKGLLDGLIPDKLAPDAGRNLGVELAANIGKGFASAKGGIVGGGIAALAPEIGALVAAGVVGAVGLGGIIGGVALAAKGPAIKGQAKELGKTIGDGLKAEADQAFGRPLAKALDDLGGVAQRSIPKVGKIFDATAPSVQGLTDDLGRFTDGLLSGAVVAAEHSGPVLDQLGDILGDTGESLGKFLAMAGEHSDEAATALGDVNEALQDTITVATTVVDALAAVKGGFDTFTGDLGKIPVLGAGFDTFKRSLMGPLPVIAELVKGQDDIGKSSLRNAGPVKDLAGGMDDAARAADGEAYALAGLAKELHAQADPTFALIKAQDDLAKAQGDVAKAQSKYGQDSPQYRDALHQAASAALDLEAAAGQVATTSNGKLTPALKSTLQAAGLTGGQINALEKEFGDAKRSGDRFAKTYTAKVKVNGLAEAQRVAQRIRDTLAAIKDENVNINYTTSSGKNSSELRRNIDKNREYGGPVRKGHAYIVGEKRPEVFVPDRDGRIVPSLEQYQRATGMQSAVGAAAAPMQAGLLVSFDFGPSDLGQLLIKTVRTQPAVAAGIASVLARYIRPS
jgi:hypothetical protein